MTGSLLLEKYFLCIVLYPGRIRCSHSVALHAGDKAEKYGMVPLVGEPEIDLIKSKGDRDDEALVDCWSLPYRRLINLTMSRDTRTASVASNLRDVIKGNPSNFILAEQRALQRLDVESTRTPVNVSFYRKSGRVSVSWQWTVSGDDAVKIAILAPPNDVVKKGILGSWLKRIPARVKKVISDLERKEIQFEYWWIKE